MKKYMLLAITLLITGYTYAQSYRDALRFSQQEYEGTARYTAMGGAFGALGGDFTTLSTNPAGIGVYRSSEFTITPTITYNKVNSEYMGVTTGDSRTRFGFSNLGYVGTFLTGKETGLVAMSVGVGYNKTMNYSRYTTMEGSPTSSASMIDYFLDKANYDKVKYNPNDLGASDAFTYYGVNDWDVAMAYGTSLIGWDNVGQEYLGNIGQTATMLQRRYSSQSGNTGEYVISMGGNVSNKLYFGVTFGIQDLSYENIVEYDEQNTTANPSAAGAINNFYYRQDFLTTGTGYNGKFGVIYKPTTQLMLGAAIHTPTYFYLSDEYWTTMTSQYNGGVDVDGPEYPNYYEYRVISPLRAIMSAAYRFGKIALLSVDYEYINYSGMRMKDSDYRDEFDADNDDIKEYYQGTSNLHIGGEVWINNNIAARAGFVYNESPNKNSDLSKYTYSAGLGYRYGSFFADFAYSFMKTKDYYKPYDGADEVTEKENKNRFMLTLGFRF